MDFSDSIQLNENMARTASGLKFRLTLFFIFFFVAIFAVFIITSVLQVTSVTQYICSQLGLPTVEQVRTLIDGDAFEALAGSLDEHDPYYEETRIKMLEIKERVNCNYLYTMAPMNETTWRFVIDGSASPEDGENFSPLGAEEDISGYEAAFFETINTRSVQFGQVDRTEDWGTVISTYGPIFNSSGEMVGLIGCDLAGDRVAAWIRTQVFWQLGVVVLFILAALTVYILLLKKIDRIIMYEKEPSSKI
jgi:methyl-accepting chemotaxis protein